MGSNHDNIRDSLISIACEQFRFKSIFIKIISKLSLEEQSKYSSQFAWFTKKVEKAIEDAGLKIVSLEGQEYDPGMAVTPLNMDDFDTNDILYVEKMIEPIIMSEGTIIKTGTVILGRK